MATLPLKRQVQPEETFGIKTTLIGTVTQDGKEWPIRAAVLDITPALAQRFLDRLGKIQRRMKTSHLAAMERDMAGDRFVFTGEPLIIGSQGNMIDGQHRCTVCVRTGKNFTCLVLFGVPESSYRAINVTSKRTGSDTLAISGYENTIILAAVAVWIYRWQNEDLLSNVTLSPTEVDEIVSGNPGLNESIAKTYGVKPFGIGHAFPAFCHFLFSRIDPDSADEFFSRLTTDVGHQERSPILALRRKLLNPVAGGRTLSRRQTIVSLFKTWNFYRQGKECRQIVASIDEAIPRLI